MVLRKLPSGQFLSLDEEDAERLSKYRYYLHKKGYAYRFLNIGEKRTAVYIHHDVMGKHEGMVIDHISGDKLDNRKENLRITTNKSNLHNTGKQKTNSSSRHKGVSWNKTARGWSATIHDGKHIMLGLFETEDSAAIAYNEYVKKNRDNFAHLNDVVYDMDWESKRIKDRRSGVGKSKYIGVSWSKVMNKWQCHIMVNYKSIFLGLYDDEKEAAAKYNEACVKYRGDKARLNEL